jgi:hypothetical protein
MSVGGINPGAKTKSRIRYNWARIVRGAVAETLSFAPPLGLSGSEIELNLSASGGLELISNALAVKVDGTSIAIANNTLSIPNGGVTLAKLGVPLTKGDLITFSTAPALIGVGADGQVLTANSSANTGLSWANASSGGFTNPMTTAGDVIYGGANGTATRLGIGTDNQVLVSLANTPQWSAVPTPLTTTGDIFVYEGPVSGSVPPRPSWAALSGMTNSANFSLSTDGNLATRWDSGTLQAPGQVYGIDLGASATFGGFDMEYQASPNDGPLCLNVDTSPDAITWTNQVTGLSGGTGNTTYSFSGAVTARYVRFTQTCTSSSHLWSIHEMFIVGGTATIGNTRLPVGTNGQVLTSDSTSNLGLSWANASGGGGISLSNYTASEAIAAGALVNIWNNSGAFIRNANSSNVSKQAHGFAPSAISNGSLGGCNIGPGKITGLSGLTIGTQYFLGTGGAVTSTAPTANGTFAQAVGVADSNTSLQFLPGTLFLRT